MSETVNLPGIGQVKKPYVYAGVAAVGVLAVMYYRNRNASGASSATSTTASDSGIDPNTNLPYGSTSGYDPYGSGYGAGGYGYGGGSAYIPTGQFPSSGVPGSFTSDAEWSQYAEDYLVNTEGMGAATVGNALGKYITGQPVTQAQKQIIDDAIAIAQYPPVNGPGNFPPSIRMSGSATGGKTYADNPVTGITTAYSGNSATVKWHESNHASSYKITLKEGTKVVHSATTGKSEVYTFHNLKHGTKYVVTLLANPAKTGAKAGSHEFQTPKGPGPGERMHPG